MQEWSKLCIYNFAPLKFDSTHWCLQVHCNCFNIWKCNAAHWRHLSHSRKRIFMCSENVDSHVWRNILCSSISLYLTNFPINGIDFLFIWILFHILLLRKIITLILAKCECKINNIAGYLKFRSYPKRYCNKTLSFQVATCFGLPVDNINNGTSLT